MINIGFGFKLNQEIETIYDDIGKVVEIGVMPANSNFQYSQRKRIYIKNRMHPNGYWITEDEIQTKYKKDSLIISHKKLEINKFCQDLNGVLIGITESIVFPEVYLCLISTKQGMTIIKIFKSEKGGLKIEETNY